MTPAVVSLVALLVAIVVSMVSRLNVGVLAIGFAWLIGVYVVGWKPEQVAAGFPVTLFLMLAGVTLLFALSEVNGTLERLANRAVALARGNARLLPILFFVIALALASVGPGSISAVAIIIPLAMPIGIRAGIPPLLTSLMVANGANAGNLSPISAVGIIANSKMAEAGITGHEWDVWFANFLAHVVVSVAAYFLFGGANLLRRDVPAGTSPTLAAAAAGVNPTALDNRQWLTVAVVSAWVVGVIFFKLNVGFLAFAAAAVLVIARASDEGAAVKRMPWSVIVMVSGVTLLIALLEKTGGMDLFTSMLARLAVPQTLNATIAFVTGLISSWSSTSGVVLPAFLPTVADVVAKVGGGDPVAVALSINVGSSLVDVSPLSTLGALCVATLADPKESGELFRRLLIWGLSMSVVGAVLAAIIAPILAR